MWIPISMQRLHMGSQHHIYRSHEVCTTCHLSAYVVCIISTSGQRAVESRPMYSLQKALSASHAHADHSTMRTDNLLAAPYGIMH